MPITPLYIFIYACTVHGARRVSVGQNAYTPRGSRTQATLPRDQRCSRNYTST